MNAGRPTERARTVFSDGDHLSLDDGDVDGDLEVCLRDVLFKVNVSLQDFDTALDVFQSESEGAFVHLLEVVLGDASAVVVEPQVEASVLDVLGDVHEAGVAVLQHVVDEFLHDAEDEEFLFGYEALAIVVEAAAGVHGAGSADFLEEVVDSRFQTEILQGRRHQAVGDVPYQLDGIVDDLFGVVDALELGAHVLLEEVLVEVEPGCGQERSGIIVQVGCDALAFLLLPADGGVQENLLLLLLQFLELHLVPYDPSLVEDDKDHQGNGK